MDLFNKRWSVRILALLHSNNGARFVVMKQGLEVNADSLTRNLQHLMDAELVERNPGYGHPLRPEYILTARGRALAPRCEKLVQAVARLGVADTVYRKWSVPLLVHIRSGNGRFSRLRDDLGVNPRALTQSLHRLRASDLVMQKVDYRLTASGNRIAVLGDSLVE